jgi:hypothetical protein
MTPTEKVVALLIALVSVLIVIGFGTVIVAPAAGNPSVVESRAKSLP